MLHVQYHPPATALALTLGIAFTLMAPLAVADLDAPSAPTAAGSAMHSLKDVCQRLDHGTTGTKRSGAFTEPTTGPANTDCSLDEVMEKAPAVDANAVAAGEVATGKTFWSLKDGAWGKQTGTAAAGENVTGTNGELAITLPDGLYSGSKKATASDSNLDAANIKSGTSIFGVTGTHTGIGGNVQDTSSGDATAPEILSGKKAWVDGAEVTGSMADKEGDNASTGQSATGGVNKLVAPTGFYDGGDTVTATDAEIAVLDADITPANIKKDEVIFGVTGTLEAATYPSPVAATGQTTSHATGDDGDKKAGKTASPRFTDNSDGTVTDNLTGLIWLKNAYCANATKNWSDALTFANTLADGSTAHNGGDCDLADGSTAGQWRLPNIKELQSMIDVSNVNPALPTGHPFTSVQADYYWSSTIYAGGGTDFAWSLYLAAGNAHNRSKSNSYYVWPVRGGDEHLTDA